MTLNFFRSKTDPKQYSVELVNGGTIRFIGMLDTAGAGRFTTSRTPDQILRKDNAIGVNAQLIREGKFKWVFVNYQNQRLSLLRTEILSWGIAMTFTGWEEQYFVPLEKWRDYKVAEDNEPAKPLNQLDLGL